MAGAYARDVPGDALWHRAGGRSEGFSSPPPWPQRGSSGGDFLPPTGERIRMRSPMRGGPAEAWEAQHTGLSDSYGRLRSPIRREEREQTGLGDSQSLLRSPLRAGSTEAASASHWSRWDHLDRSGDGFVKASTLPSKDIGQAQRAFEQVQMELLIQSRRQDELFDCVARVEADLSRVARLAVENEELHSTERQQKHAAMADLTRRTEDALLTCESLRKGQEHLIQKVERLEAAAEDRERIVQETRSLQRDMDALQGMVREKLDALGHALRRLDAMEQIFDENTKLRQEVAQLRRANERRDLEMAAVQGQIDALTKLVREQLREPLSPAKAELLRASVD